MKHTKTISILLFFITAVSAAAAAAGIFSNQGPGPYEYESIRGQVVTI